MSRAAVLAAPRRVEVVEREPFRPRAGHAVVRIDGCGVCGSDMPLWQGRPWFQYPLAAGAPGHEAWGHVEEAGGGCQGLEGRRVAGLIPDGYAQHSIVPAEHLVLVPDGLPDDLPLEPIACAVNAAGRSGFSEGRRVAVVGAGFLGALMVRLAAEAGASVTAVSRRETSCRIARDMGAQQTFALARDGQDVSPAQAANELGEDGFDVVVEAAGHQEALDLAGRLVSTRGRLVIAGYHQEHRNVDMQQWNWKGIDVVNAHERDPRRYLDGMRQGMELMSQGRLDPQRLITHRFRLDSLGEALEAMETRPDGFLKGVVRP